MQHADGFTRKSRPTSTRSILAAPAFTSAFSTSEANTSPPVTDQHQTKKSSKPLTAIPRFSGVVPPPEPSNALHGDKPRRADQRPRRPLAEPSISTKKLQSDIFPVQIEYGEDSSASEPPRKRFKSGADLRAKLPSPAAFPAHQTHLPAVAAQLRPEDAKSSPVEHLRRLTAPIISNQPSTSALSAPTALKPLAHPPIPASAKQHQKALKPVSSTRIAQATDVLTDSGQFEIASMFMNQTESSCFLNQSDKELRRGLLVSPQKGRTEKGKGKYIRYGFPREGASFA
jgi:hypothetical protein